MEAPGEEPTVERTRPRFEDHLCPVDPDVHLEKGQAGSVGRVEEQNCRQEEQEQQPRRHWTRMIKAKSGSLISLSGLESRRPRAGAGKGSIAPKCNAVVEPQQPQIKRRVLGRWRVYLGLQKRFFNGFLESEATCGPWRRALPQTEPLYNKLCRDANGTRVVRNIRVDYHAHWVDEVVGNVYFCAHDTMLEIYDIGLPWLNGGDSKARIKGGHHYGIGHDIPAEHKDTRLVYIDVRKVFWATVGNIAFQGFAWPFEAKKCKSIVRALFSNHCRWADVLVVRGRNFRSRPGRYPRDRILENLLWHWRMIGRPYLVYKEGSISTGSGGQVPKWLVDSECYCSDFCQCSLVGQGQGPWYRSGQLFSNVVALNYAFDKCRSNCVFKCDCEHQR